MKARYWVLGTVAAAGIATAAAEFGGGGAPTAAPVSSAPGARPNPSAPDTLNDLFAGLRRSAMGAPRGDLFGSRSEAPARIQQAAPVSVQPPLVFPYRYAGTVTQGGKVAAVLVKGNEMRIVEPGESLDGWRVTAVLGERINVTYLASGEALVVALLTGETDAATPGERFAAQGLPAPISSPAAGSSASIAPPAGPIAPRGGAVGAFAWGKQQQGAAQQPRAAQAQAPASGEAAISSGAVPSGQLGHDAPAAGSMPVGPAPTSKGRLGI